MTAWQNGQEIDTLAAAYAETGNFEQAIKYQKRALRLIRATPRDARKLEAHLALFEKHQPFRQTPRSL